jgi:hypothetical protein
MANPTGNTYLQANVNYSWTDGDVYELVQTDTVEAAAAGASFSGLGVVNQPHQVLLNKINYLHSKQVADEATLASLQSLSNLISSDVGTNGWLKLGANDINLGQIQLIIQWGTISLLPFGGQSGSLPTTLPFSFPIAYPNACWLLLPYWQTNITAANMPQIAMPIGAVVPLLKQGNQIAYGQIQKQIAYGSTPGLTGIGWVSLGY